MVDRARTQQLRFSWRERHHRGWQRARLADIIRARSFGRGEITLASGRKSDFYFNLKPTMLDPEGAALLAELTLEALAAEANRQRMPSTVEEGVIAPMPNAPTDAPKEAAKERAALRAREL